MAGNPLHTLSVRIYYEDTDAGGVVYHANYLRYAERGRTEMLREMCARFGLSPTMLGVAFAVRRCEADYRRPARLDDLIIVDTHVRKVGGASINLLQTVRKEAEILAEIQIDLVCVGPDFRATRVPEPVRAEMLKIIASAKDSQESDCAGAT